jgi:O-antigen/teichoic acid export membrane protein
VSREGDSAKEQSLGDAAIGGVRWLSLSRFCAEAVQFAAVVVLARLVSPAEFGRLTISIFLLSLAISLTGEGFGNPIVQRKDLRQPHLQVATLLSVGASLFLGVAVFLLAPVVVDPLFGERAATLAQTMSPIFPVLGARVVPYAVLQRRLQFKRLSIIELTAVPVTAAVSITLAANGLGAQAIILGMLAGNTASLIATFNQVRPVMPRWRREEARELLAFGGPAALSGMLWSTYRNVDYVILAARLSAGQVGFYYRAYQLGVDYQSKLGNIVMAISFPVFSRADDLQVARALRTKAVRAYTVVLFPILAVFVVVAPVLVPWAFGARWASSAQPAQLLVVAGAMMAVGSTIPPLVLASGRSRLLLGWNIATVSVFATAVFFAAPAGLTAVAGAVVGVTFISLLGGYWLMLGRLLHLGGPSDLVRELLPALSGCAVLVAAALPLKELLERAATPDVVLLLCTSAVGGLAYIAALRTLQREAFDEVTALVGRILGRPRALVRAASANRTAKAVV